MGLLDMLFGQSATNSDSASSKTQESVLPTELLQNIAATTIPNIVVNGNQPGISQIPGLGTNVGLYGFNNLNTLYNQAQNQLTNLIPSLSGPTTDDISFGQSVSDMLYNQGKDTLNNQLDYDIQRFREDSFSRGMGASSSFLQGIKNLMGANASALAQLKNQANNEGLKYAWDLANQRMNTAQFLNGLNSDLYSQLNQIPMSLGLDYAIPQAQLTDANKDLNFDRLASYYTIFNNTISDYNNQLQEYNKNQNNFVTDLATVGANILKNSPLALGTDALNGSLLSGLGTSILNYPLNSYF